jgi:hypothetical protein
MFRIDYFIMLKLNFSSNFSMTLLIVHILAYSNNSFNFLFYGLFSKQYRETVAKVLKCYKSSKEASMTRGRTIRRTQTRVNISSCKTNIGPLNREQTKQLNKLLDQRLMPETLSVKLSKMSSPRDISPNPNILNKTKNEYPLTNLSNIKII